MNNKGKFYKKAQKISLFLLSLLVMFGLFSPTADAALTITTLNANNVTYNSATLKGILNEGSLSITGWFEFGTNPNHLDFTTNTQNYDSLSSSFSAPLTGLYTGTTYYFRAVAQNTQGRTYGNIMSFTTQYFNPSYTQNTQDPNYTGTAPAINTNGFNNVTSNSVILSGYVNGNNLSTTAWFEWGPSNTTFANSTTQNEYGFGVSNFNITLIDLKPNTIYYFRAVAQNGKGRVFGNTLSFATTGVSYNTAPVNSNVYSNTLKASIKPATRVNATYAQLNALIINTGTTPSNTYFEWGKTNALGERTESISTGALPAVKHANTINNLTPDTTYYVRAVADNGTTKSISETTYFITSSKNTTISSTKETENTPTITPLDKGENMFIGLGANTISSGSFLPGNLFGWILFVLFILLLILLVQHLFLPQEEVEEVHAHH